MKTFFNYNFKQAFFISALSLSSIFIYPSCDNIDISRFKINNYNKETKKSPDYYSYNLIFNESFELFFKLLIIHDKTYNDNILIEEMSKFLFVYPDKQQYSVEEYYQAIIRIKNHKFQFKINRIIKLCENYIILKRKLKNINNQILK